MRLAFALFALLLMPSLASAQRVPAYQDGAVLANDALKAITGGRYGVAGGIGGDVNGLGMNPTSITDLNGIAQCAHSAKVTGTLGVNYHSFCYGHNASGSPIWKVDGTDYAFGTNTGNMLGPNSTTVGHVVTWNNTAGSLTADPGTAILTAGGLGVAVGETLAANAANIAFQVKRTSTTVDGGKSDSGAFVHSSWGGNDSQANVNSIYGDLWYNGAAANTVTAIRGNVYTYANSGTLQGSAPTQYFSSPTIGTLAYLAGVYGRTAVYLPGTVTYAAAVMADGIYNIGTGATVTYNIGFLAAPGAAKDAAAASYAFFLKSGSGCSPTCWTATFKAENDPLTLATKNGVGFAVQDPGGSTATSNYLSAIGSIAGAAAQLTAGGETNVGIQILPRGAQGVAIGNPTGGTLAVTGAINVQGGYYTNGVPGIASQTCTVNQAKTLIFTNGLLTGGNCNT